MKLEDIKHIPWWRVHGNPLLRNPRHWMAQWDAWKIEDKVISGQPTKKGGEKPVDGLFYYDRSFVLTWIQKKLLNQLCPEFTKEEIHELIDEAFDFDLEEYKKQWLQTRKDNGQRTDF